MWRYVRFRFRSRRRQLKKEVGLIPDMASSFWSRHVIKPWRSWLHVRRFAIGWLTVGVCALLALAVQVNHQQRYYVSTGGAQGGTLEEGVVGDVSEVSLNPLFPEGAVSTTAQELIFNGLVQYDEKGQLVGDLAERWEVSTDERMYTFFLRKGVLWHNGTPFTARDVEATFSLIRNPDVRSPLRLSWEKIAVTAVDEHTVQFTLPNAFTPFIHSLTTPIVPSGAFSDVEPARIRASEFSQNPIGTGPFVFREVISEREHNEILFDANQRYFRGPPMLDRYVIRSYSDNQRLLQAFVNNEVDLVSGLQPFETQSLQELPDISVLEYPLTAQVTAFFKNQSTHVADPNVRAALTLLTNKRVLALIYGGAETLNGPLLPEHVGYLPELNVHTFDEAQGMQKLDQAGWVRGEDGIRRKDGVPLQIRLVTQNLAFNDLANALKDEWSAAGIDVSLLFVEQSELLETYIRPRNYDVLLIGIKIGPDPDVYSYWHSSQVKDPGQNFAEFKDTEADLALESGRTRRDTEVRAAKYQAFQREWNAALPALPLLRPNFITAEKEYVRGPKVFTINDQTDRYFNVHEWTVLEQPMLKTKLKATE